MPYKKNFVAGDKLLAQELIQNFTDLEPVNEYRVDAKASYYGGDEVSALSVFIALAEGANDGAIAITIDGVALEVDILLAEEDAVAESKIAQGVNNTDFEMLEGKSLAQVFTIPILMMELTKIVFFRLQNDGTDFTWQLRTGSTPGAGSLIEEDTNFTGQTIILTTPLVVEAGEEYHFIIKNNTGNTTKDLDGSLGSNLYDGGNKWTNASGSWVESTNDDLEFQVWGRDLYIVGSLPDVAERLQIAIRALTGNTETVDYLSDFGIFRIISSVEGGVSEVSTPTTPASGTDMSGNGATKYFDLVGGVESSEPPSENKVIKTGDDGRVDGGLTQLEQMTTTERGLITAYTGQVIYNSTTNKINFYNGATWEVVTSS